MTTDEVTKLTMMCSTIYLQLIISGGSKNKQYLFVDGVAPQFRVGEGPNVLIPHHEGGASIM